MYLDIYIFCYALKKHVFAPGGMEWSAGLRLKAAAPELALLCLCAAGLVFLLLDYRYHALKERSSRSFSCKKKPEQKSG